MRSSRTSHRVYFDPACMSPIAPKQKVLSFREISSHFAPDEVATGGAYGIANGLGGGSSATGSGGRPIFRISACLIWACKPPREIPNCIDALVWFPSNL